MWSRPYCSAWWGDHHALSSGGSSNAARMGDETWGLDMGDETWGLVYLAGFTITGVAPALLPFFFRDPLAVFCSTVGLEAMAANALGLSLGTGGASFGHWRAVHAHRSYNIYTATHVAQELLRAL